MPTLLFVDDEPGIRETMPLILEMHGYKTTAVATVAEALKEITSRNFDVLISDLNIGQPGDGFTVVSAMRRTQPKCRTIIITGYPALETALQAIRTQVDDYIVKPADSRSLIAAIEGTLSKAEHVGSLEGKRLSTVLRESMPALVQRTLAYVKDDPKLAALPLTDEQRIDHIPPMVLEIAAMLESDHPDESTPELFQSAVTRGQTRFSQGYSADLLVTEFRMFVRALNDVIHENLLTINLSKLMIDFKWLNDHLGLQLEESFRSYLRAQHGVAAPN